MAPRTHNPFSSVRVAVAMAVFAAAIVAVALAARPAGAAFGDDYDIMPINSPLGPVVPALADVDAQGAPVYSKFFWAGACDRGAVTGLPAGTPLPDGGIGSMPTWVPATGKPIVGVAPPSTPKHCIDWQIRDRASPPPFEMWTTTPPSVPPQWRLGSVTQAGAHADGSTTFGFDQPGQKGSTDNIVVKLPPGFVADPNAVPKCGADEFAAVPPQCPAESQVGMLSLRLEGEGFASNGFATDIWTTPVYNLQPRRGNVAELGFPTVTFYSRVSVRVVAKARTNGDFGVTAWIGQIPNALPLHEQAVTIWGVPWAAHNDVWRAPEGVTIHAGGTRPECSNQPGAGRDVLPASGLSPACQQHYDRSWGDVKPFVSLETDCNQAPVSTLLTDAYQFPGAWTPDGRDPAAKAGFANADPDVSDPDWKTADAPAPPVDGCEKLPFSPDIDFQPGSSTVGAPSGLSVDLNIPQNNTPPFDEPPAGAGPAEVAQYVADANAHWNSDAGLATAHLKDSVVTLPAGFSVNPSGATGLQACSDGGIGITGRQGERYLFNNGDPFNKDNGADGAECPDASKIGTARVRTPLLDEPLTGEVVLGSPESTDPRSGRMLRLFIVVRDPDRGLIAKVFGTSTPDGTVGEGGSGQLSARFVENPEVPFDNLRLDFKDGPRGMLAMPQACGSQSWSAAFTPWSSVGAPVPVPAADDGGQFTTSQGCGQRFIPELEAGSDNPRGGGSGGTFSFRFWREDGEPWLRGLTAKLPQGLLADTSDLPLCTNARADAGACPAASKIGFADAKAGAGDPFVIEEKGEVFLTEGYKGCAYGLAVKIRAIAGPFRGPMELSPIVVRQAVCVDPDTAQVSAVSDPFPLVHHGVPLRTREVDVIVNRAGFMRNPTGCAAKAIRGSFTAADGQTYSRTTRFQVADCKKLRFKPRLEMRLTGRKQIKTGRHPGVRAQVTQKRNEAGIRRAVVRLPKSLALDVDNAQALCEFDAGTKPDLENHCPKGSIVGRARAVSPLLKQPLAGNVYFVKNIRIDKRTGNEIRTLPMIIAALRGEVAVNLRGNSNTTRAGKLVSKFRTVPDAPVTRFNLNIKGGKNGILAVTQTRRGQINLCHKPRGHKAEAYTTAHSKRHHDRQITLKTPCNNKKAGAGRKNRGKRG